MVGLRTESQLSAPADKVWPSHVTSLVWDAHASPMSLVMGWGLLEFRCAASQVLLMNQGLFGALYLQTILISWGPFENTQFAHTCWLYSILVPHLIPPLDHQGRPGCFLRAAAYIYKYMYVTYVCVCMYVYMNTHMCMYSYGTQHIMHIYIYSCIYIYICMHIGVFLCVVLYICICIYIYIYIYMAGVAPPPWSPGS